MVAMYLFGEVGVYIKYNQSFSISKYLPRYKEFVVLHNSIYGSKIISLDTPNQYLSSHSSDSNQDLVYFGNEEWYPKYFDFNNDDYLQV